MRGACVCFSAAVLAVPWLPKSVRECCWWQVCEWGSAQNRPTGKHHRSDLNSAIAQRTGLLSPNSIIHLNKSDIAPLHCPHPFHSSTLLQFPRALCSAPKHTYHTPLPEQRDLNSTTSPRTTGIHLLLRRSLSNQQQKNGPCEQHTHQRPTGSS